MNPIQEAIEKVMGLDEIRSLNDQLIQAIEHVNSQNALLQRQIEDIDYLNLFDLNSIAEVIPLGDRKKTINKLRRLRHENPLAKQSVQLIKRFTLGKGVQLVVGPDPEKQRDDLVQPDQPSSKPSGGAPSGSEFPRLPSLRRLASEQEEESDQTKDILNAFWDDDDNKLVLTSEEGMKEWLDANITDGEHFFICFEGTSEPYVKLTEMPLEEIEMIVYDPRNWKKPVYYKRVFQDMEFKEGKYLPKGNPQVKYYLDFRILPEELPDIRTIIRIPPKELAPEDQRIFHSYINPLWTKKGKRGLSELYASREWFRVYKEFMEDRAAINAAATSVAYKRKIKGGPTEVARFANKLGGLSVGYDAPDNNTEIRKLTRPAGAAIYDSNPAVDLEWMKTDTGAVNAKEDARALLASAGAGVGTFLHYFGEGGDANLATAQAMELPMVKTFEDWQQWVEYNIRELSRYVLRVATDLENAKKQIKRVSVAFPPIVSQDVVKYMTSWSQFVQNVAPGNRIVHREAIKGALTVMNVPNIDALMAQIEAEEEILEEQRLAQQQAMLDSMRNGFNNELNDNGNGNGKPPRNGSSNALDPDLKRIASGKPGIPRNGPKSE